MTRRVLLELERERTGGAVLGPSYKTLITFARLTDAQMIQAMATENATGETESVEAQIDVVIMAEKFLTDKSGAAHQICLCGESLKAKTKDGHGRSHEPGSQICLSGFLGWDRNRVKDLLSLRDRLPKRIREHIMERAGSTAKGRDDGRTRT